MNGPLCIRPGENLSEQRGGQMQSATANVIWTHIGSQEILADVDELEGSPDAERMAKVCVGN